MPTRTRPKAAFSGFPANGLIPTVSTGSIIKGDPAAGIGFTIELLTHSRALDEASALNMDLSPKACTGADDYSSAAFRLRPEAVWQDGVPVTPEDVILGF